MIEAIGLTKRFDEKTALDSINLKIEDGWIYGLIGSNGSGKSTLLRLIAGIYSQERGSLLVEGEPVYDNTVIKTKIGYLGDTPYFGAHDTLKEMKALYQKIYESFDTELYHKLLDIFPLDHKIKISAMSKGMQRQAALIMAISASPKYLLLDEAFDGLDAVVRKALKGILIDRAEKYGFTTIAASHNLRELEFLCDHTGLLHNGKLLFSDSVDHLKGTLHKVQAAFRQVPEKTAFSGLDVLRIERSGSLLQMVIRGETGEILAYIDRFSPIFSECVEPSLEEIFCYELEVTGYDAETYTL